MTKIEVVKKNLRIYDKNKGCLETIKQRHDKNRGCQEKLNKVITKIKVVEKKN